MGKFILTKDTDTAKALTKAGFILFSLTDGVYTFINLTGAKLNFEEIPKDKISFTNILPM